MTILVTGATGQVGGAVVRELGDLPVRVLVRDPATLTGAGGVPAGGAGAGAAPASAAPPGTVPPGGATADSAPTSAAPPGTVPPGGATADSAPTSAAPPGTAAPGGATADGAPTSAEFGSGTTADWATANGARSSAAPTSAAPTSAAPTSAAPTSAAPAGGATAPVHVERFAGSFDDAPSLRAALDGVSVLFLTGRDNPAQVEQHVRVLEAARAAGVSHVVKLSAIGARADSPVALMRWHHAIEGWLRASSFAWTFLRPHLYMQNLLRFAGDVADGGRLAAPMGAGHYPLVDTRDVGAAAAAVLRDPAAHAGRTYSLTGPAALTYDEIATALAALVGRPVIYDPLEPERFRAGLIDAGIPEWRAGDLAAIGAAYTEADNAPSEDLPALLGRPATRFERFLTDHRQTYLVGASRSHL